MQAVTKIVMQILEAITCFGVELVNSDLENSVGEQIRELLEDFDVLGTPAYTAIIPRINGVSHLADNVQAALVATNLGLRSLDYARKNYVQTHINPVRDASELAYIDAYRNAKHYIQNTIMKLQTNGRPDPTIGVFSASLVLERLPASFFCAHFLYQMGHKYEGHAVARLILEQISWAFAAYKYQDIASIAKTKPTAAIGTLKQFVPKVGRLYGYLSLKTHIDQASHREFLFRNEGKNHVLHGHSSFLEYTDVILHLADLFAIVWESTQANYISSFDAIFISSKTGQPELNPERSFLEIMQQHLATVRTASTPDA